MAWSFWEKETWLNKYDIIIVGAGFVGLWTAYKLKLKEPHLKIAIIEKGVLPTGASTKNAGFSCFGSVSELMHDVALMGESAMLKVVEMRYKGLKEINATFPQHSIDYHNLGGYELFSTTGKYPIDRLRGDIYYLNNLMSSMLGLTHTFHETSEKIAEFGFQHVAALAFSPSEGQLHPAKLVQLLLQMIQKLGVILFLNTTVEKIESNEKEVFIQTDQLGELKSNRLIVCTNGFAKKLLPSLDVHPTRGQVFVTAPIPNLKVRGTFHFDEGYYYFRNVGNQLLLGGARNKAFETEITDVFDTTDTIQDALESFMMEYILPAGSPHPTIESRWSGIMGMGAIKQPIIKEVQPNVFCAVRMSGMGVSISPIVAAELTEMVLNG